VLATLSYLWLSYIPRAVVFAQQVPITATPADVGMDFEDISLTSSSEDVPLAGWWMPAADASAVLVFIHGGSSNRHTSFFSALEFYRAIHARGISVFAIDLRNHGASGNDGQGIRFGLSEQADALAAVNWAAKKNPRLPVIAMGISMGGATLIHAAQHTDILSGLVLLDPLLDTQSAFTGAVTAESGIPAALVFPAALAAQQFYGFPKGDQEALEIGKRLDLPMLLIQDPGDPVTRAQYASELAGSNSRVQLWLSPEVAPEHPKLAWRKRWGSHVVAFTLYPEQTLDRIEDFIQQVAGTR
jgi:pimeloyl-ACP methyl ester carboxylesterase